MLLQQSTSFARLILLGCVCAMSSQAQTQEPNTPRPAIKSIYDLDAALQSPDRNVRLLALRAVENFRHNAAFVVPRISLMLVEDETDVRAEALKTLSKLKELAKPAVPSIVAEFRRRARLSDRALEALWALGSHAACATPGLIEALNSSHYTVAVRKLIPETLAAISPNDPGVRAALMKALVSTEPELKAAAGTVLWEMNIDRPRCLRAIESGLVSEDSAVRKQTLFTLGKIVQASPSDDVLAAIAKGMLDKESGVRWAALMVCDGHGVMSDGLRETLVNVLLKDPDRQNRSLAASSLRHVKDKSPQVIAPLRKAVSDPDPFVRVDAARTLIQMDAGEVMEMLGVMTRVLESDASAFARGHALEVLGKLGSQARPAINAIRRATQDESEDVRMAARSAIRAILADGQTENRK